VQEQDAATPSASRHWQHSSPAANQNGWQLAALVATEVAAI